VTPVRVLVLVHPALVPPAGRRSRRARTRAPWRTEYDVCAALRALGHRLRLVGVDGDLAPLQRALAAYRPDVVFNLLEQLAGEADWDWIPVAFLETLGRRTTGCNPLGLLLCRDKAICKRILRAAGVPAPSFVVFRHDRRPRPPARLAYPLLVKPLGEQASLAVAQASLVHDAAALCARVRHIQRTYGIDAIAESYIDGREITVGALGNARPRLLPPWELCFGSVSRGARRIATARLKWDPAFQRRHHVHCRRARLSAALAKLLRRHCHRAWRALGLSGYVRFDFRVTPEGAPFLIDVNPNPQIAEHEDFADAARAVGLGYPALIAELLRLAAPGPGAGRGSARRRRSGERGVDTPRPRRAGARSRQRQKWTQ
jgi:D-alanine-D-alanine ligase